MKLFEFTEELSTSSTHSFLEKLSAYKGLGVNARISVAFVMDIAHVHDYDSEQKLVKEINDILIRYNIPLTVKYIDMKRKEIWYNEN